MLRTVGRANFEDGRYVTVSQAGHDEDVTLKQEVKYLLMDTSLNY